MGNKVIVIRMDYLRNMQQLYPWNPMVSEEELQAYWKMARYKYTYVSSGAGSFFQVTHLITRVVQKVYLPWNKVGMLGDYVDCENGLLVFRNKVSSITKEFVSV